MSKAQSRTDLKYLSNDDLRMDIVAGVGISTDRYGGATRRRLSKSHLVAVAKALEPAVERERREDELHGLALDELYEMVCAWAGGEYGGTAGNQWGINRENLKRIHRTLAHD